MALVIPVFGDPYECQPAHGRAFTLQELQAVVGGYLEALRLADGRVMFLNEEGKLDRPVRLPLNRIASVMAMRQIAADDYIAGDVIVCSLAEAGEDGQGEADDETA